MYNQLPSGKPEVLLSSFADQIKEEKEFQLKDNDDFEGDSNDEEIILKQTIMEQEQTIMEQEQT